MDDPPDRRVEEAVHRVRPVDTGGLLKAATFATILLLGLPILLGLFQTTLPAFGIFPAIGGDAFSLAPWRKLFDLPGIWSSLRLSVFVGFTSTALSLLLSAGLCAWIYRSGRPWLIERMIAPILAAPHAAMAIGLAFLVAPSGWFFRLVSPWATGWTLPPALTTVHDRNGLALILALVIKETPFLAAVILAALNQVPMRKQVTVGRSLGYNYGTLWLKVIFPQVYRQIRLPVMAVLAFSLSVVDVALILGPSTPPVLSVAVIRWFQSPDIEMMMPAAAGALLQVGVVIAAIAAWRFLEALVGWFGRAGIWRGGRGGPTSALLTSLGGIALGLLAVGLLALTSLGVWSFAWRWNFPDALPSGWSTAAWSRSATNWIAALSNTVSIGVVSSVGALLLAVSALEGEERAGTRARWLLPAIIFTPLLLPQIGFVYGLQVMFLKIGLPGNWLAVAWAHLIFVFPYVLLSLGDPWRSLDPRLGRAALALGVSPGKVFFRIKLPMLLRPLLVAGAIGFSVSVALYLPTLFMGAGRITTLTSEAVALSSGADRRVVGVYAVLQAILPFLAFGFAFIIPRLVFSNRKDMRGLIR